MSRRVPWLASRLVRGHLNQRSLRTLQHLDHFPNSCGKSTTRWHDQLRHYSVNPHLRTFKDVTNPQYSSKEVEERAEELLASGKNIYPRYSRHPQSRSIRSLVLEVDSVPTSEDAPAVNNEDLIQVFGRVSSIRTSGSKLVFLDLVEDQTKLQVVLSLSALESRGVSKDEFRQLSSLTRRGDWISISASPPYRAKNGQTSVKAASLPEIQAPCLNRFPVEQRGFSTSEVSESQFHPRHVEMLTDPEVVETIKLRSVIIKTVREFFEQKSFVEVQTPVLAGLAGGAIARPFQTSASEFPDRNLSLRIAPELWLKRLIIGGLDRVFEIGPSFRNEGLDKTHNPEFTTCEFYAVRHDLPQLMQYTQELLTSLAHAVEKSGYALASDTRDLLRAVQGEYQIIDFLPALDDALGQPIPNLTSSTAHSDLLALFTAKSIPLPAHPTTPRMLDTLSSIFLEPRSLTTPTWIINIPECLSPLAKSYPHATHSTSSPVAARAELFIAGKEVVNCYEEENSPFDQRRKFSDQQIYARQQSRASSTSSCHPNQNQSEATVDAEITPPDEPYLQALEWGLPPTGGWGCGIDRLVMLFSGRKRIGDVLTFGNLRHVTRGATKREK